MGYTPHEVTVSDNSDFNIALQQDSLEEVVATALGLTREKKSLGYSVTEVSGNNINTVNDHNIASSLSSNAKGYTDAVFKLGGPDEIGTGLWWDTGGPNF